MPLDLPYKGFAPGLAHSWWSVYLHSPLLPFSVVPPLAGSSCVLLSSHPPIQKLSFYPQVLKVTRDILKVKGLHSLPYLFSTLSLVWTLS